MTILNYIQIETESQQREFITDFVKETFKINGGLNTKEIVRDIISEFKRNYISYRIGLVTMTVSRITDKLIYNI